ncbi:hypothetical protein MGH68_02165 [Erysipelothrix sp. D19-032]
MDPEQLMVAKNYQRTGINNSIAQLGLFTSFMGVIALLLEKLKRRV